MTLYYGSVSEIVVYRVYCYHARTFVFWVCVLSACVVFWRPVRPGGVDPAGAAPAGERLYSRKSGSVIWGSFSAL